MRNARSSVGERDVPELLAPAGSFETALAAFAAGADAVYLGLDAFSARAEAVNFTPAQLRDLVAFARRDPENAKRVYVTFNTLITDDELPDAVEKLAILSEIEPDGIIVQDLGVARIARRHFPSLVLHASTQLVAHNLEGVLALRELGFSRVVLARELSLEEIRTITQRSGVEIEVFVHGALCYSLSGLCLFSALEKNRSGNRGRCAYCCRLAYTDGSGRRSLPFSMRDLRLDDSLAALADAGVASLKIEGRMKSALYVASAVKRYRDILDGAPEATTRADLETVFSRRTTHLYIHGYPDPRHPAPSVPPVIDPSSLGHLGTPIGEVKRITRDREGRAWIRFHTNRALEKHDGLQFAQDGDKPFGFGISEMRTAISRRSCFAVPADTDVEILLPNGKTACPRASAVRPENAPCQDIKPGAMVFCSASNEMKRRFPVPSFRPGDVSAGIPLKLSVSINRNGLSASASSPHTPPVSISLSASVLVAAPQLDNAKNPAATPNAVRKAFGKLGGTGWRLAEIEVTDPDGLFVPPPALNEARRRIVAALDDALAESRAARIASALDPTPSSVSPANLNLGPSREPISAPTASLNLGPSREPTYAPTANLNLGPSRAEVLKLRLTQPLPPNAANFAEIIVVIGHLPGREIEAALASRFASCAGHIRLALPVFTHEADFNALRSTVKHLMRAGFAKWEASDLAALRLLRALGATDITADWPLYSFNRAARAQLAEMGVTRMVASPEAAVTERPPHQSPGGPTGITSIEFLARQSTPLFLSLTRPAADDPSRLVGLNGDEFTCHFIDGLWTTTRAEPRTFSHPSGDGVILRTDISWD